MKRLTMLCRLVPVSFFVWVRSQVQVLTQFVTPFPTWDLGVRQPLCFLSRKRLRLGSIQSLLRYEGIVLMKSLLGPLTYIPGFAKVSKRASEIHVVLTICALSSLLPLVVSFHLTGTRCLLTNLDVSVAP